MKRKDYSIVFSLEIWLFIFCINLVRIFYNWDSHAEFQMYFPINLEHKHSSYYQINGDLILQVMQVEGDADCEYDIYYQIRGDKGWTIIVEGKSFIDNDELYEINTKAFRDTRYKVVKNNCTDVYSILSLTINDKK